MGDDEFEALQRTHAERLRRVKRAGWWRSLLSGASGLIVSLLILVSPVWLKIVLLVLLGGWLAWGAWSLHPGKCIICGKRTVVALPHGALNRGTIPAPAPIQAWWDLRPPSRAGLDWICLPDLHHYMIMSVNALFHGPGAADGGISPTRTSDPSSD